MVRGESMSNKYTNEQKVLNAKAIVFKQIALRPCDITTLKAYMLKKKLIKSGNKFQKVFDELQNEGKIILKKGYAMVNPKLIKEGRYFAVGKSGYITIDGDVKRYYISRKDAGIIKSNQAVRVAFVDDNPLARPFIISTIKKENDDSLFDKFIGEREEVVTGRVVKKSHDELIFIPNGKRFSKPIVIVNEKSKMAAFQDKICQIQILSEESANSAACGQIVKVLGDAGNPIQEYEVIARSQGGIMSWEDDERLVKEIAQLPEQVNLEGRTLVSENGTVIQEGEGTAITDLTDLPFVTVDPATCQDMDDAIYSKFDENGNLVVYTAVANVTKYVDMNSEIFKRYIQGGFTIYAPNRAYNILPPKLSTGICSLNPNVNRLALVVRTVIDKSGKPIESKFMDAVIESKGKYSYEQAQKIFDESELKLQQLRDKESLTLDEQIVVNKYASDLLWRGFSERDLINFAANDEYDVVFNESYDDIIDILPQENCDYHKVIEAFMLTANEAAAKYTSEHKIPSIYRVHEQPNDERSERAFEFFSILGVPFDGDISPKGIKRITNYVKGTNKEKIVNNFLVRLQNKAKYASSPKIYENSSTTKTLKDKKVDELEQTNQSISHFGLQSEAYSHLTSPIRRITDFAAHYNILASINGGKFINEKTTIEIAQWANDRQDEVKYAEEQFQEVNSAIYCEGHIGEVLHGEVVCFKSRVNELGQKYLSIVIENEEKGIKVEIPAAQLLKKSESKLAMSRYACSINLKESSKPLIKVCDEVDFKILAADRNSRSITVTSDLQREKQNEETDISHLPHVGKPVNIKKQKMIKNQRFEQKNSEKNMKNLERQENIAHKRKLQKIKESSFDEDLNTID